MTGTTTMHDKMDAAEAVSLALRSRAFTGKILTRPSLEFGNACRRYSALAELDPSHIAFPVTETEVASAINVARQYNIPLAIKGGGNHAGGASSVDNGLVIDLEDLILLESSKATSTASSRRVLIDGAAKTITVSGGCRWGEVYTTLHESDSGLLCVGGGVHVVGVGGHLLGGMAFSQMEARVRIDGRSGDLGGYGPLVPKYGMGIDNIISLRLVLASGEIVTADAKQNQDLFWAVKGMAFPSGGGDGYLGRYTDRKLFSVWSGHTIRASWLDATTIYPASALPQVLDVLKEYEGRHRKLDELCFPFLIIGRSLNDAQQPIIIVKWTAAGRLSDWDHHLKLFYDNPHNGLQKPIMHHVLEDLSIVDLSHSLDGMLLHAPRRIATAGMPVTGIWDGMVERCSEALCAYIDRIGADAASSKIMFEFHGAQRTQPNQSSYHCKVRHFSVVVSAEHSDERHDKAALAFTREITEIVRPFEITHGGRDLYLQGNGCMSIYSGKDIYGEEYSSLQSIKTKYDPNLLFNRWHPISPAN